MCARIQIRGLRYRPGDPIPIPGYQLPLVWGGRVAPFARSETSKEKWPKEIWERKSLQVEDYAERDDATHEIVWAQHPARIAVLTSKEIGSMVVLTKQANPVELAFFGHPRHPVVIS